MNEKIQRFKKLCFTDSWSSEIGTRFNSGDLNKRIEIITAFKEMIKEQFQKVGVTKVLCRSDFNDWYGNFQGYFKYENKFYFFSFCFWAKRLDIQAVEVVKGKSKKSNRLKEFWINNDRLIPDKEIFKLPKHRKFNIGDVVLFRSKHICKVIDIKILSKIYYELEDMCKMNKDNRYRTTYTYITEYYLKSLAKGI